MDNIITNIRATAFRLATVVGAVLTDVDRATYYQLTAFLLTNLGLYGFNEAVVEAIIDRPLSRQSITILIKSLIVATFSNAISLYQRQSYTLDQRALIDLSNRLKSNFLDSIDRIKNQRYIAEDTLTALATGAAGVDQIQLKLVKLYNDLSNYYATEPIELSNSTEIVIRNSTQPDIESKTFLDHAGEMFAQMRNLSQMIGESIVINTIELGELDVLLNQIKETSSENFIKNRERVMRAVIPGYDILPYASETYNNLYGRLYNNRTEDLAELEIKKINDEIRELATEPGNKGLLAKKVAERECLNAGLACEFPQNTTTQPQFIPRKYNRMLELFNVNPEVCKGYELGSQDCHIEKIQYLQKRAEEQSFSHIPIPILNFFVDQEVIEKDLSGPVGGRYIQDSFNRLIKALLANFWENKREITWGRVDPKGSRRFMENINHEFEEYHLRNQRDINFYTKITMETVDDHISTFSVDQSYTQAGIILIIVMGIFNAIYLNYRYGRPMRRMYGGKNHRHRSRSRKATQHRRSKPHRSRSRKAIQHRRSKPHRSRSRKAIQHRRSKPHRSRSRKATQHRRSKPHRSRR